ncbi:AMP-binding protein [Rhodococcus wratislaviensis]|uniref:AMP-binding protein n=1 Tax=Rhodococcus wratislaviensis TaxID=44752 RepID=UPI0035189BDE
MKLELLDGLTYNGRGPVQDLLEAASDSPDLVILRSATIEWTVADLADGARRCAAHLLDRGITAGQRVAIISGNSVWRMAWQFGIHWIGAVEVSVNSELRGPMLEYVLSDSRPDLIVIEQELAALVPHAVAAVVPMLDMRSVVGGAAERSKAQLDQLYAATASHQLATILYTSGTTGPSKGVMLPQAYFSNQGAAMVAAMELRPGDVGYFPVPFFHVDAHILISACLQSRSTFSFNDRFSLSRFWAETASFGATWFAGVGSMVALLMAQAVPSADETRLSRIMCAPVPPGAREFFDAMGIEIRSLYGQTEAGCVTFEARGTGRQGTAGRPVTGFDVAIQNTDGETLASGETGEVVYRPAYPNLIALGYWERPEATVEAWRGLWFHTGDLGRMDDDGYLHYQGRITDSLRRRGENISAYELESAVRGAPHVVDCAAVSVLDEVGGEDEIKLVLEVTAPEHFDIDSFFDYCDEFLPRFAQPAFIEIQKQPFTRAPGSGAIHKHNLSRATTGPDVIARRPGDAQRSTI